MARAKCAMVSTRDTIITPLHVDSIEVLHFMHLATVARWSG